MSSDGEARSMFRHRTPGAQRTALAAVVLASLVGCGAPSAGAVPASAAAPTSSATASPSAATTPSSSSSIKVFAQLERQFGARLGVYALDTGSQRSVSYHADQRFAYASTSKVLATAAVLHQDSDEDLNRVVHYTQADLVSYSPVTEQHVDTGMTLREIIDAALRYSDNTAANLLFAELGGPRALGADLKAFGDTTTQVNRTEPDLNTAIPGDRRDTSTPRAMAADLQKFTLGTALNRTDRALLVDTMTRNTTGATLIRAGAPSTWTVADKTGSAGYGTRNDIAVLWPPHRAPIVLAVLSTRGTKDATYDDALIAQATTAALASLQ
jgi:beta-lactamase class A